MDVLLYNQDRWEEDTRKFPSSLKFSLQRAELMLFTRLKQARLSLPNYTARTNENSLLSGSDAAGRQEPPCKLLQVELS